jgi:hypothetical protein
LAVLAIGAGIGSAPAAACPWNGCGTDAYNAARSQAYYYGPVYGYAPMAYGYAGYGYAPPVYAPPVYGYGPMYGYAPPMAYGYYTAPPRVGAPPYRYGLGGASQIGYQGR